jgi:hypothetical protein
MPPRTLTPARRYTGWQWAVAKGTYRLGAVPALQALVDALDAKLGLAHAHNHWIVTRYEEGKDNIGLHSDKDKDWADGSAFAVVKLGAPRPLAAASRPHQSLSCPRHRPRPRTSGTDCLARQASHQLHRPQPPRMPSVAPAAPTASHGKRQAPGGGCLRQCAALARRRSRRARFRGRRGSSASLSRRATTRSVTARTSPCSACRSSKWPAS